MKVARKQTRKVLVTLEVCTPPKANMSLKNSGWNMRFCFGNGPFFRGHVRFRWGKYIAIC